MGIERFSYISHKYPERVYIKLCKVTFGLKYINATVSFPHRRFISVFPAESFEPLTSGTM